MESLGDRWVDVDEHVLLDQQALIALINLLADPVGEGGLHQRVANIGDPLLGQLGQLFRFGQVVSHNIVRGYKGGDIIDGQALILRDCDPGHVLALDGLLPAGHQVLQEVDGHLL